MDDQLARFRRLKRGITLTRFDLTGMFAYPFMAFRADEGELHRAGMFDRTAVSRNWRVGTMICNEAHTEEHQIASVCDPEAGFITSGDLVLVLRWGHVVGLN